MDDFKKYIKSLLQENVINIDQYRTLIEYVNKMFRRETEVKK